MRLTILLAAIAGLSAVSAKSPALPGKETYHLFNPTPKALLREMSTDRPDVTESPFTVDAGRIQMEWTLLGWARDASEESLTLGEVNFKLGLTHRLDLQIVLPLHTRIQGSGEGLGDLQVRAKWNVWGNDGGATAFALMPYVKVPTAADGLGNDVVEGGLILPFAADLPAGWGLGAMLQMDWLDEGLESTASVALNRSIFGPLAGYLECVCTMDTEKRLAVSLNGGFSYTVNDDLQLDAGVRIGLNEIAEEIAPFVGFSVRF